MGRECSAARPKRPRASSTSAAAGPAPTAAPTATAPAGGFRHSSGNAAFDDYRAEQLKRLEEERKRLDEEIDAFHEYMRNLRMAKDREEFDRFMRDRSGNRSGYGESHTGN